MGSHQISDGAFLASVAILLATAKRLLAEDRRYDFYGEGDPCNYDDLYARIKMFGFGRALGPPSSHALPREQRDC